MSGGADERCDPRFERERLDVNDMCHTREDGREGRGRAGGSSGVTNSENLCAAAARWARGAGQVRMQASSVVSLVISFKTALQVTAASS